MSTRIHIDSQLLRKRLAFIEDHHKKLAAEGYTPEHHGIVPDLICEILRLRGEEVPELSFGHFPEYIVTEQ